MFARNTVQEGVQSALLCIGLSVSVAQTADPKGAAPNFGQLVPPPAESQGFNVTFNSEFGAESVSLVARSYSKINSNIGSARRVEYLIEALSDMGIEAPRPQDLPLYRTPFVQSNLASIVTRQLKNSKAGPPTSTLSLPTPQAFEQPVWQMTRAVEALTYLFSLQVNLDRQHLETPEDPSRVRPDPEMRKSELFKIEDTIIKIRNEQVTYLAECYVAHMQQWFNQKTKDAGIDLNRPGRQFKSPHRNITRSDNWRTRQTLLSAQPHLKSFIVHAELALGGPATNALVNVSRVMREFSGPFHDLIGNFEKIEER